MSKQLLILDDEPYFARFIARIAQRLGWAVETTFRAGDFRHALAHQPDAVALDLQLGDSDGVEQLRLLKEAGYLKPILLMSGFDDRVLVAAREYGTSLGLSVAAALKKPARAQAVRDALEALERQAADPSVARKPIPVAETHAPIQPAAIAEAIARREMVLFLQPIIAADSFAVRKFEALIRWRHPQRGLLTPDNFIPIAEQEIGVIDQLTQWVFETAIDTLLALRANDVDSVIAVNISARNLHAVDLPDRLEALMRRSAVAPRALQLELTESAAINNPMATIDILSRFRLKGFELAIDDFGTGFAALETLKRLPFSEIKIDKSFVGDLLATSDAHTIVSSVIEMARRLGLGTVAEGVETAEAAAELRALGINNLQGYYIGHPQPIETIPETVAALRRGRDAMDRATRRSPSFAAPKRGLPTRSTM
jgi:EAL domain-containing protein (putative c-di-GMP-specific phosphodiesterase class I)/FixJ family two-component response regulator